MSNRCETYLDIETDGYDLVTVVGFYSDITGHVQLVGSEITFRRLCSTLPGDGVIYTFNGERFDIPVVRRAIGLDLLDRFESCDLMRVGWAHGFKGGQKALEDALGFARELPGLDGRAAIEFWRSYMDGDDQALDSLLRYNAEDLEGMRFLKHCFESNCCLSTKSHCHRDQKIVAVR